MLADIGKDTVDFVPNFDETEKEPTVLPSRFPNLLVNGTTGIAVGMATNIPPHNLREVINGVVKIIDNQVLEDRGTDIEELFDDRQGTGFSNRRYDSWNRRNQRGIPDRTRKSQSTRGDEH